MRKTGYSLVEVLMVVCLLAILAAIAVPRMGADFIVKMKVRTTARNLMSDLRYARRLAITRNESHTLNVNAANNEYSIHNSAGAQVGETRSVDSAITLDADKTFMFESLGNANFVSDIGVSLSTDGNKAELTIIAATGRIDLSGP